MITFAGKGAILKARKWLLKSSKKSPRNFVNTKLELDLVTISNHNLENMKRLLNKEKKNIKYVILHLQNKDAITEELFEEFLKLLLRCK